MIDVHAPGLGLCLGGGGTLAGAHIGVLQVMHARGIRPGLVVGTSAGALVGAAFAMGIDPDRLEDLLLDVRWQDVATVPRRPGAGLLDAEALRASVVDLIGGDVRIEDMPMRFAAVATDVASRRATVIERGSLVDALRATISVPGLFRPVQLDGRRLLDGGLKANLPLEETLALGATPVLAVRVAPDWDVPGYSSSRVVRELSTRDDVLVLSPDLRGRTWWQTRDLGAVVAAGRAAAEAALPR
ncbi:patatin-like phospholipase family protein [Demequina sp. SYSU T00192]|uniref:Patatin-like phospholipase family protein n=1 Tax=Demequina litoralis TaxID=3051660 RepID=A0ABT8G6M3_9MICO|nr:patatin-like phospholipase family protein [Demequina sp. SYSU T00192]MDN4474717.1 patatin-like phospholipase family protein [Demequina sp. SYSU T00192]